MGAYQGGTVEFCLTVFSESVNCGQYMEDKNIKKISDNLLGDQNLLVGICVFPLQQPQISRDFDSFSNILEN